MSLVAVPVSLPVKRRIPWVLVTFITAAVIGIAVIVLAITSGPSSGSMAGQFYRVIPMDMDITINKDGELHAVNNVEITNQVEGQNTILDIAKEGTFVYKGDIVCRIDSSEIETKIESAQLDLQRAEADLTAGKENKEIQDSSNLANYEAANVDLILAKLDLQEYVEGIYPSDLQAAKTAVEMAKIEVKNREDDLDQTRNLFGKGFVTAVDVKTAEIALLKAKNDFNTQTTDLDVLQKYTHEKELTDRKNKVAQAEKKLTRVQRENASQLAQKVAELRSREESLKVRTRQMEHLKEQLAFCVIKAPQDGMVVYSSSSSSSWGRRETPIQPGAQVRGQELLIRLPDTSAMKVVCKINEVHVAKLRVDPSNPLRATVKVVGQTEPLTGWLSNISIMADNSQRWFNPDAKEYPVDVTLDYTPPGLKPGMSVDPVKVFIDRLHNVLAVPVGAVYAAGSDNYVFLRGSDGAKPVKVTIGQVNDTHAQVSAGVSQGQQVLILKAGQGRELLEKAGIKVEVKATSTTRPFVDPQAVPPVIGATTRPQRPTGERGALKLDNVGSGGPVTPRPKRAPPVPQSSLDEKSSSVDGSAAKTASSSDSSAANTSESTSESSRSSSDKSSRSSSSSSRRRSEGSTDSSSDSGSSSGRPARSTDTPRAPRSR